MATLRSKQEQFEEAFLGLCKRYDIGYIDGKLFNIDYNIEVDLDDPIGKTQGDVIVDLLNKIKNKEK